MGLPTLPRTRTVASGHIRAGRTAIHLRCKCFFFSSVHFLAMAVRFPRQVTPPISSLLSKQVLITPPRIPSPSRLWADTCLRVSVPTGVLGTGGKTAFPKTKSGPKGPEFTFPHDGMTHLLSTKIVYLYIASYS